MIPDDFLAVDLGAGSGRVVAGRVSGDQPFMQCIHRFPTRKIEKEGRLYWDTDFIFTNIIEGIRKSVEAGFTPRGIGIDTWGVDYVLISPDGIAVREAECYRDTVFAGLAEEYGKIVPDAYSVSGIQPMDINTDCRLFSLFRSDPSLREKDMRLLMMSDYFAWRLSGVMANEFTSATTTGLIDARTGEWSRTLLSESGIPAHIFSAPVPSGTPLGRILPQLARITGAPATMNVYAVAGHDTQSAVLALPPGARDRGSSFLISGTWSLLGMVTDSPCLSDDALNGAFSNEGLVAGKQITLLQNITGMWILQRLMEEWRENGADFSFDTLIGEARNSGFNTTIDVDSPALHNPKDMQEAVRGLLPPEAIPQTRGDYVRCLLISLADRYRRGLDSLSSLSGIRINRLYIAGGGSRNSLLNEMIASAAGIEVIRAEAEASAAGNIITQAKGCGSLPPDANINLTIKNF